MGKSNSLPQFNGNFFVRINDFAGNDEGRPACRPTPEARKEIHSVMVKTFGEKNAAEIEQNFETCAGAHIGKLRCLIVSV